MNCSALNAHLFIRNLVESPNCICGITETVFHFLLDCPITRLQDNNFSPFQSYSISLYYYFQVNCVAFNNILTYICFSLPQCINNSHKFKF